MYGTTHAEQDTQQLEKLVWIVKEPEKTPEIEKKEYTRAIVLNPKGEVLVIQRKKESSFEGEKWELPGGKLDKGENHDEALLRELFEETGLVGELIEQKPIVDERLMSVGNNSHGGKVARTESKMVMVEDTNIDLDKLHTESMAARWCSKRQLEELYEKGELSKTTLDIVTKVLLQ